MKTTLAAVATGDADAAIVYTTDAEALGTTVEAVRIPAWLNVYAIYPIAPIAASANPDLARAWIRYTVSPAGPEDAARASGSFRRRSGEPSRARGAARRGACSLSSRWRSSSSRSSGCSDSVAVGRSVGRLSSEPAARDAIRLSVECSLWSTALLGGVRRARSRTCWRGRSSPARSLVRALVVLPMVLPPVVGGVALLLAFQRHNGLVGGLVYDVFGFQFTFSKWGVVLAETFVAMPFLVITVEAGLRSMDRRYEDAAASLGAGRWTVFRRVTVPMIAPALIAGAALAWARALGEFGATITFAGNIQGRTQTTPLAVYNLLETDQPVRGRARASCSSPSPSWCWCRCATTGSEASVTQGRRDAER